MMDFRRFRGSFEHDFCSCGRQRNGCFQKFACAELILFWFLLIMVYLSREEFDWRGGDCTERLLSQIKTLLPELFCKCSTALKNFFFKVGRSNQELELGKADYMLLKIKRFLSWKLRNTAAKGSIVNGRKRQDWVWFICDFEQLPVCSLNLLNWWYLNICLLFVYIAYTLGIC